jgi:hypothetical protein
MTTPSRRRVVRARRPPTLRQTARRRIRTKGTAASAGRLLAVRPGTISDISGVMGFLGRWGVRCWGIIWGIR